MLDALRLPRSGDDVRAGFERRVRIAARDSRAAEHVDVLRIDLRRARLDRLHRIEDRGQHLVFDLDELRRLARDPIVVRRDGREHVAHVTHFLAHRDEARPVVVEQPVPALARNVRRGHDRMNSGQCAGLRGVDPFHLRARMGRERERAVQHPFARHVRDVRPRAEHELDALVARERITDAALRFRLRNRLAAPRLRHVFDGIDDLHVARAPAQMHVERLRDLVARWVGILVDEVLRSQRDAGDAEAALQTRGGDEALRDLLALFFREPLERDHFLARDLLRADEAGDFRLAVHQREAATALTLRLTPVLHRRSRATIAKRVQERFAGCRIDRPLRAVQSEFDRHGLRIVTEAAGHRTIARCAARPCSSSRPSSAT